MHKQHNNNNNTNFYTAAVITSEAVAQLSAGQSLLSVIISYMKHVSFEATFNKKPSCH